MKRHPNPAIDQAMASLAAASPKAAADPTRPIYHFRPPANWMNDPNGTIYHDGYYHLFYQHNPYGDTWGHIHWGHARSKDLVHWEHLPIALWPSLEQGEEHCFSGCAWINDRGQPMLCYTKVSPDAGETRRPNEQWAALGDEAMILWQKHPANPILQLSTHGGPAFEGSWRDPFIFEEAGRTFMVVGATTGQEATVALYEAADGTLTRWTYRGLLISLPLAELRFFECPNFFKLDDKWILLTSPYRPVEYFVGGFDLDSLSFTVERRGILDYGRGDPEKNDHGSPAEFYATNIIFDRVGAASQARCILLGWVRGFKPGRGWNGCLALPRLLTIDPDGQPRQQPVPELQLLRGEQHRFSKITLDDGGAVLDGVAGDALEIEAVFEPGTAATIGLKVRRAGDGRRAVTLSYDGQSLDVAGTRLPLERSGADKRLKLHLFLDKSVLEVFVDEGRAAITRVIYPPEQDLGIEVFALGGQASLSTLNIWEMKSIWT